MSDKDQIRKIQFTGKSSYIVSLPKDWIKDLGLKQGDQVTVGRKGSTTLEVKPINFEKSSSDDSLNLVISPEDDESTIVRKLIGLYFLNLKTINVKPISGTRISPTHRIAIRNTVKKVLMGSEITADSTEGITVQILINLTGLSVDGAFKRMLSMAKSMQTDALLSLKENNGELAQEVINSDDDVDRFGFYIIRQLTIAIENQHMLKEIGFKNSRDCLGYRVIVKNIERIGDHAVTLAQDAIDIKKPIKGKIMTSIEKMNEFALTTIDNACLALFKNSYLEAENAISETKKIKKYENEVLKALEQAKNSEEIFRVRRIAENIRRIAEYASDIGEIVLNMNIEKVAKKS
ncbi:MAG: phosphate uptake regulator PhoU [Crenarchaeota archaeon]|nr:phosphate uptake regulator PhoU [Thermoproteota archaeon]